MRTAVILPRPLLLGGVKMSALNAHSEGRDDDPKDALVLLEQALEILDSQKVSPEVGARLQDVINQLRAIDAQ